MTLSFCEIIHNLTSQKSLVFLKILCEKMLILFYKNVTLYIG